MIVIFSVELVNSQVMLKGCETSGYAIVCAVNVQLTNCSHWPAWRDNQLTNKTTWVGKLDGLQVSAGYIPYSFNSVMWHQVQTRQAH